MSGEEKALPSPDFSSPAPSSGLIKQNLFLFSQNIFTYIDYTFTYFQISWVLAQLLCQAVISNRNGGRKTGDLETNQTQKNQI